eukprot:698717-Rhodomonas_salina.1
MVKTRSVATQCAVKGQRQCAVLRQGMLVKGQTCCLTSSPLRTTLVKNCEVKDGISTPGTTPYASSVPEWSKQAERVRYCDSECWSKLPQHCAVLRLLSTAHHGAPYASSVPHKP